TSCEAGTQSASAVALVAVDNPGEHALSSRHVTVPPLETRRACVPVPPSYQVTAFNLQSTDPQEYCRYRTDTGGCSYVASRALTVVRTGGNDLYCWTAYNESHNRQRDWTIFADNRPHPIR